MLEIQEKEFEKVSEYTTVILSNMVWCRAQLNLNM